MKELTTNQINTVAGAGGDVGREIAQGLGAGAGTYVGGTPGAIVGGIAAGQTYDWASTHTPDPSLSPSGLGERWEVPRLIRTILILSRMPLAQRTLQNVSFLAVKIVPDS